MEHEWREPVAASYLKTTFFRGLTPADARNVFSVENPVLTDGLVLWAPWWGSYQNIQPGSASGTQPVEAFNAHDFHAYFVDKKGNPLTAMAPPQYMIAFAKVLKAQGREQRLKLKQHKTLPDLPTGADPCVRSGAPLQQVGRSTAQQFYSRRELTKTVDLGSFGKCNVMPRSLLRWRPSPDDWHNGEWEAVPEEKLQLTDGDADLCARLATELDATKLRDLWVASGILTQKGCRLEFSLRRWDQMRYHRVVVLEGNAARKLWHFQGHDVVTHLCPCLPFALTARCEHETCVKAFGSHSLEVAGAQRGRKLRVAAFDRGASSRAVFKEVGGDDDGGLAGGCQLAAAPHLCECGDGNGEGPADMSRPRESNATPTETARDIAPVAPVHVLLQPGEYTCALSAITPVRFPRRAAGDKVSL